MKLHVANLSPKVTIEQLEEVFSTYGRVLSIELSWNESIGRKTGKAIVEMHTAEALAAVRALNGRPFRSRRLYITPINVVTTPVNIRTNQRASGM